MFALAVPGSDGRSLVRVGIICRSYRMTRTYEYLIGERFRDIQSRLQQLKKQILPSASTEGLMRKTLPRGGINANWGVYSLKELLQL